MDNEKRYTDSFGNKNLSLQQMVIAEPMWAASRIREGEKAIKELADLKTRA